MIGSQSRVLSYRRIQSIIVIALAIMLQNLSQQSPSPASQQSDPISWQTAPSVPPVRSQADWLIETGQQSDQELFASVPHHLYKIADTEWFFPLSSSEQKPFVLRHQTANAYFWFEPEHRVTIEELESVAHFFEEKIWTITTTILSNGTYQGPVHIIHQSTIKSSIMGAFNRQDQCPRSLCPESNQRDIVYELIETY